MRTFIFCIILLFAMNNKLHSQGQIKKGKWMLTHTLGGFYQEAEKIKAYQEDVLDYNYKDSRFGFRFNLSSPTYASMQAYTDKYENIPPDENGSKTNRFNIYLNPEVGYFVKDGLLIGSEVTLGYYTYKERINDRNSTYKGHGIDLGIGPFIRYYFKSKSKHSPFAGLNTNIGTTIEKSQGIAVIDPDVYLGKDKDNSSYFTINPAAGYAWFLGKHWSIYLQLEYSYFKNTTKRTRWSYENNVLNPGYPRHTKYENNISNISLNGGVSFTF